MGGQFSSGFYQGALSGAIFYTGLRAVELPINKIKKLLYNQRVQTKGEAGNLVMRAYRGDGGTASGHAWNENAAGTASFGGWPSWHAGNENFDGVSNVFKINDLWFNREVNINYSSSVKLQISLSTDQVNGFANYVVNQMDFNYKTISNNCSCASVKMWEAAGGGAINNRSMLGIPTVKALADSIERGYGY